MITFSTPDNLSDRLPSTVDGSSIRRAELPCSHRSYIWINSGLKNLPTVMPGRCGRWMLWRGSVAKMRALPSFIHSFIQFLRVILRFSRALSLRIRLKRFFYGRGTESSFEMIRSTLNGWPIFNALLNAAMEIVTINVSGWRPAFYLSTSRLGFGFRVIRVRPGIMFLLSFGIRNDGHGLRSIPRRTVTAGS